MLLNREVVKTADGSKTIHIGQWNENYHSSHGALQEAKHVFIQHGLSLFLNQDAISLLEVGFGTGLNAALTLENAANKNVLIHYVGVEAFPVTCEELIALNYADLFDEKEFSNTYDTMHVSDWEKEVKITPDFSLTKRREKLQTIQFLDNTFDLIYFDAFGPRVQGELWTIEIFTKMYKALKTGGVFVTYCAKGQVKRDLKSVGFTVEVLPGPPGKREMTRCRKA